MNLIVGEGLYRLKIRKITAPGLMPHHIRRPELRLLTAPPGTKAGSALPGKIGAPATQFSDSGRFSYGIGFTGKALHPLT